MGTSIKWLIEPTIMLIEDWGTITQDELNSSVRDLLQMLNDAPSKAHLIVDIEHLSHISPPNPFTMPEATQFLKHPNRGWVIIAGSSNRIFNFWLETFSKIGGLTYKLMPTVEEGKQFLLDLDRIAYEYAQQNKLPDTE